MTFYFYDLETSGLNPRQQRVMQFAGVRTNELLEPIGEPHNLMIRLSDDILPDPDAILVTGITPQKTIEEGLTEAEFLDLFHKEIYIDNTIFVGYNNVRFDDEFIRYMLWRNFYDPYEWQWKNSCSRWDLLDVVRMTRALRPDGIEWPIDDEGKATNRLELLTKLNGLDHEHAHDALNDVMATIAVAKLIKDKQPKLFDYMLGMRDKKKVAALVQSGEPFVYTSGRYASEFQKTAVVQLMGQHPDRQGSVLVYDLRHDPSEFLELTPAELATRWEWTKDEAAPARLPVKVLSFNRCPSVAPIGVLDAAAQTRLSVDLKIVAHHRKVLLQNQEEFMKKLQQAMIIQEKNRPAEYRTQERFVDGQLYDGFVDGADRAKFDQLHASGPDVSQFIDVFADERLKQLVPLYKGWNYKNKLTSDEREVWESYRHSRLLDGGVDSVAAKFFRRLAELAKQPDLTKDQQYLLEELNLYGQSILPISES